MKHRKIMVLTAGMLAILSLAGCATGSTESPLAKQPSRSSVSCLTVKWDIQVEQAIPLEASEPESQTPEQTVSPDIQPTPTANAQAENPPEAAQSEPELPAEPSPEPEPEPEPAPVTEPAPEPEPAPATEPEPEPVPTTEPEPEPEPTPSVDIGHYVAYAQSTAQSLGLSLDSSATACWDTPVVIGPGSTSAEQSIWDLLSWYSSNGYTGVCVWSEPRSDGTYNLYIGYA